MNLKNVVLCALLLVISSCAKNHSIETPESILISSIETPSNISEISDIEIVKEFVSIFDVDEKSYLSEESSFDSTGLITIVFKYKNHEVGYTVYKKNISGDYSYFKYLDSNTAYRISDEAYRLIESYLP